MTSSLSIVFVILCGFLAVHVAQSARAPNPCPHGWLNVGTNPSTAQCFKFYNNKQVNFKGANDWCNAQGGYVATDTSSAVHNLLKRYLTQAGRTGSKPARFWLGLFDDNKDAWKWVGTGQALGANNNRFQAWSTNKNQISLTKNKLDMAYFKTSDRNAHWYRTTGTNMLCSVICQRNIGSVKPTTTKRPRITCDQGYTLYSRNGGTCIRLVTQNKIWTDARAFCQADGGDLVQIKDTRFNGWLNGRINRQKADYWIGLHDRHKENKFEWLDSDIKANYTYWKQGQPDNGGGTENCVEIHQSFQFHWNDATCSIKKRFICQKITKQQTAPATPKPTPADKNCGAGWEDDPNTDSCYQINDDLLSWLDARAQCKANGGDLAAITTIQEQYYLSARTLSFGANFYWTGANDRSSEGGYNWVNGNPMAFVNWAAGQPNNNHNSDCVAIVQSTGRWNDYPCQNRYGYICEKTGRVTHPKPKATTSPAKVPNDKMWGCPIGWRGYRGSCYQILQSPRGITWADAKSVCSGKFANLATITDRNENRFVFSMLPKPKTGSGGAIKAWIGLNDQAIESSFMWTDGLPVTYTNWDRANPNNAGNQDCVSMDIKTGKWNDYTCSSRFKFMVCKQNKALHAKAERDIVKGCSQGIGYGARCYSWLYSPMKNFADATKYCKSKHGDLATVDNRHVQAFLASEMSSKPGAAYWIGLSMTAATQYNYTWNNKVVKTFDYSAWDKTHTGNENNTCVAMKTSVPAGLWVNYPCNKQLSYICDLPRRGFTTPKPTTTTPTVLTCPAGWVSFPSSTNCYKPFTRDVNTSMTWTDSRDYCSSLYPGGNLITIKGGWMRNWAMRTLLKGLKGNYWIGLNDRDSEGGYKWADGAPFGYSNWNTGEPNDYGGSEDCVQWNLDTGKWNDAVCYTTWSFICQVPKGAVVTTPKPVPTGKSTLQCGNSSWTEYNQNCYYVSPEGSDSKTWFEANLLCQDLGGNLASITSDDENAFITAQVSKISRSFVWIGLNDLDQDTFKWTDSSPLTFVSWGTDEPNDAFGSERCVEMNRFSFWNDEHCQEKRGYVCKKRPGDYTPPVRTSPSTVGGCPAGYHSLPGLSKCFKIGGSDPRNRDPPKNYTDAQAMCNQFLYKSRLASIHSKIEEKFITVLMAQQAHVYNAWIGFNDQRREDKFVWIDNSLADFSYWGPHQPDENKNDKRPQARKDCVDMSNNGRLAGKWFDNRCSNRYAYVCETTKNPAMPTEATNSTGCPAGYQRFRDSCYQYVNELYTWDQANQFCQLTPNGALVSLQDKFEMSFIELLTRGSDPDLMMWLGLHFDQTTATYVWADKWPVKFTNWGKGEPDRLANEGCVSHTVDGSWQDVPCQMQLGFACEVNLKPAPTIKTPPTAKCAKGWVGYMDSCYYLEKQNTKTWSAARYACKIKGGDLVSVHSDGEAKFITQQITRGTRQDTWIGLGRGQSLGFSWSDSTPVNYLFWSMGEPSGQDDNMHTDCVAGRRQDGSWRVTACDDLHVYICKKDLYVGRSTTIAPFDPTAIQTIWNGPASLPPLPVTGSGPATYNPVNPPVVNPTQYHPPIITQGPWHPPVTQAPWQPPVTYNPYNPAGPQKQTGNGNSGPGGMSGGAVAGVIIAVVFIIAIAVVVIFFMRGKFQMPFRNSGGVGGFDNATYSTGDSSVKISSDA